MRPSMPVIGFAMVLCVTACANTLLYPLTAGSYNSLPKPASRMLVWETNHTEAETTVTEWLRKRGFIVIDRYVLHKPLTERAWDGNTAPEDEQALLQTARSVGADSLVFVETSGATTAAPSPAPAGGQPTSVAIRGIDVKTGEVEWNAQAWYPLLSEDKEGVMASLACQALATVWGFRPAGYHHISSADMCHIPSPWQSPRSTGRQQLGHAGDDVMLFGG